MTVAILTPVLNDGDAVGNDILGMAAALRAAGQNVAFFAEKARVNEDVLPLDELDAFLSDDRNTAIYHHSIQCDAAVRLVEKYRDRAAVKFHNVTPARFFAAVNPDAVRGSEVGRHQTVRLAKAGVPFWVDSDFNGRDLQQDVPTLRYEELPPFHQAEKLADLSPDADQLAGLDDWATTLLCVGRVAPNKNLELAVKTLADVRQRDPAARLIVAGEHVFPTYSNRVLDRAKELGVEDGLIVTGRVTAAQLKALYLSADVLLVTSDHEGFCVPLVEAMLLGVPVVAVPRTAVPDTGGDAARYADDAPSLARAATEMIGEGRVRERHLLAGRRRYRERFSTAAIAARFLDLFSANLCPAACVS
jgi:glycosyltransferase involved in cell wall biosynthesis